MARMFDQSRQAFLLAALSLGLSACAGDHDATPGVYAPVKSVPLAQERLSEQVPTSYHLAPNDVLQIKVYGEPDLSFDRMVVTQAGTINMAFLGDVNAAGLTISELADRLKTGLARQINNPGVTVNLVEYGSQKIVVEGSVVRPGIYELPPGTTLLGALATAGDPDKFARVKSIAIIRTDDKGRLLAVVDLHAVRAGKTIDPVLQANDRVVVGVSGGEVFYQDLIAALPAAVLFTRIGGL